MDIYQDRIRPLFDNSGKTDAELERAIGIPPKTINKWNAEIVKSYMKYIAQIAKYFGVDTDYLLGKADDPSPPGGKEGPAPEPGGGPAYPPGYEQLTPENRARADSYLAFLLAEQQKDQT